MTQPPDQPPPPHPWGPQPQPPRQQWAPPSSPSPQAWGPPTPLAPQQWAPPPRWDRAALPPSTLPLQPTQYQQFWRAPFIKAWRPIVAVVLGAIAFLLVAMVVTAAAVGIEVAAGTLSADEALELLSEGRVSPGLVLGNSVAIGLMLPLTLLIAALVKQPPRFLHSVLGRFRWTWFFLCAAVSVVVLGVNIGLELLLSGDEGLELRIHPYTWWLLVGLMLVTPFQAAAEEYMLRGLLFRTVGSWFRGPAVALGVGTLVNSAVFTLMHGAGDPWLNLVYFVLGALLSWITWRTGGLEAAVAFHIVNNMIAFAFVPFQDVTDLFDRSAGVAGPLVLIQLIASGLTVALITEVARRRGLQRLGPPQG